MLFERLLPILPGALVVAFAFASGGFLPGPVGLGASVLAALLLARLALARNPWRGLSRGYAAGATCLGLLACLTLVSQAWSDAPARAAVEYDRVVLYLLAFLLVGAAGYSPQRLRWLVRGVAAAAFVVCLCGLISRLAPDVWPTDLNLARLTYPLGYWNALGLLAAVGIVLGVALTSDDEEVPAVRVLAAAALPALGTVLLLTFSRGAVVAGIVGLVALAVVGRPRALLSGMLASGPTMAIAVSAAYAAKRLATNDPTDPAAIAQGHDVALVVIVCGVVAAVVRIGLLALDRRLSRRSRRALPRPPAVAWGVGGCVLAVVVVVTALAVDLPGVLSRQYDRFVSGDNVSRAGPDVRSRLTDPGNNGRIQTWGVALEAFRSEPLRGEGAGTYALQWDHRRPEPVQVEDGHSLYIEVLGELGIAGFVLVVGAILLILAAFVGRARGPDRVMGGALFAAGLTWALHAGIDWDWEMPAVTLWFFAAGGLALAGTAVSDDRAPAPWIGRAAAATGCLLVVLLPVRVFLSDRPLRDSARAFARNDCATAVDRALDSSAAFAARPEPFVLLGYCNVVLDRPDLALRAMGNAVRRDPDNWEGHYGLAIAQAAAGRDPRPALAEAQRLNPREVLVTETRELLGDDPGRWKTSVGRARLPVD
ncbi:MAG: O-antigen ligase family protein [Solirubrobacteraceae bacterium]